MDVKQEVLAAFSLGTDLRWHQKRLRREYDKLMTSINDKKARGKKAARCRWVKKIHANALHKHSLSNASAMLDVSESESESVSLNSEGTVEAKTVPEVKVKRPKNIGTREELEAYAVELGLPASDGSSRFDFWESNGWRNGKTNQKVLDWKASMRTLKGGGWLPSQKNGHPQPIQSHFETRGERTMRIAKENAERIRNEEERET
jgi:hypothetical protein